MRLGLCCLFKQEAIAFRTVTARTLGPLPRERQLVRLSTICLDNARSLHQGVAALRRLGIGAFRIMSPLFPRMTHPEVGYTLAELPDGDAIRRELTLVRALARRHDIRLSFHPDQFVVLASPHRAVVANAIRELVYQAELAEAVGADVINLHIGGRYGSKKEALQRFGAMFADLPDPVRSRLTVENDDVSYTVRDLLPLCGQYAIPLVYDVHHHRCNGDGLTVSEATRLAAETWQPSGREQYCHLSSPRHGWGGGDPRPHADYIDPADFPASWYNRAMTIDIEAKAKELAVVRLVHDLQGEGREHAD